MKSPRWPIFLFAILLGLATGDAVLSTSAHANPTRNPGELQPSNQPSNVTIPDLSVKKA
ncbi:hypothetical protein [Tumebacillus flagellatus]|uniref:hypothetical protein n=1 Tax=Tumebacillus flagellatus TaxID=1157490 RepID=UPI0013764C45|nr:hypothetical protein [Tumebacillus flagellatus]